MKIDFVRRSIGVRVYFSGAAALACLFMQASRGVWFCRGAKVCVAWMAVGVIVLYVEMVRERRKKAASD